VVGHDDGISYLYVFRMLRFSVQDGRVCGSAPDTCQTHLVHDDSVLVWVLFLFVRQRFFDSVPFHRNVSRDHSATETTHMNVNVGEVFDVFGWTRHDGVLMLRVISFFVLD
jgi:hypothetical protein